jgi:hypothetical protein
MRNLLEHARFGEAELLEMIAKTNVCAASFVDLCLRGRKTLKNPITSSGRCQRSRSPSAKYTEEQSRQASFTLVRHERQPLITFCQDFANQPAGSCGVTVMVFDNTGV